MIFTQYAEINRGILCRNYVYGPERAQESDVLMELRRAWWRIRNPAKGEMNAARSNTPLNLREQVKTKSCAASSLESNISSCQHKSYM